MSVPVWSLCMVCVLGTFLDVGENEKVPNVETKRARGNVLLCHRVVVGNIFRTRATWTVNSTPMPTDAIRMTTGTALSLIPMRPIMPKSSTVIKARTVTCKKAQGWGVGHKHTLGVENKWGVQALMWPRFRWRAKRNTWDPNTIKG